MGIAFPPSGNDIFSNIGLVIPVSILQENEMAAVLAIADMPSSPETGKMLYEASKNQENADDEYLPQAFFAAALSHEEGYLLAAPKTDISQKADSLLTLSERIVKSVGEEHYQLDRWTPILFPPDVRDKEIIVKFTMGPSDEGLQGVAVAHGNKEDGYSLYMQDNKLHWLVKQNGQSYLAVSRTNLPKESFDVVAKLSEGGVMSLNVNDKKVADAKAPSLFTTALTSENIRIGYDPEESKVGDYPNDFRFKGDLKRNGVLELKKPSSTNSEESGELDIVDSSTPAPAADPNAAAVTININVVEHEMKFDLETFSVKAGQKVTLNFTNPDFMQHNFLLIQKGSLEKVGAAADALARDPKGAEQEYVPKIPEVIVATRLVNPEGRETLVFTAPDEPGEYPYVCTVPGHWRLMNGVMIVK